MNIKSHFRFNKQERSGIFYLLCIIVLLQAAYFLLITGSKSLPDTHFTVDQETQRQIDGLRTRQMAPDTVPVYRFNPNYISDFKGYALGMTPQEIDRLHRFRDRRKFVNSAREFQEVTGISDSLLEVISPSFKFPEWAREQNVSKADGRVVEQRNISAPSGAVTGDLNSATVAELKRISGIGNVLASRIVRFRDALGGFLVAEQLYDVYGLKPEVAARAMQQFGVRTPPEITPVNLNTASAAELANLLYINYELAISLVSYREVVGAFTAFEELGNIDNFPIEKIDRIKLYLTL